MIRRLAGAALALMLAPTIALAQDAPYGPLRPDQQTFLALYKTLVETNTEWSDGDCTVLATKIAGHLKAAGFPDSDVAVFSTPDHPKEGGVTAVLHGTSPTAKPMLLLGHLDVVEAKRADWTRDPFTMIDENGYFYGRGTSDMKVIDATWIDVLSRFKQAGYRPKRTIKLALTCGEETSQAFNGANYLALNHPELVQAAFALNEGGGGRTDGHGKLLTQTLQVGEKKYQDFRLETTNAGGHSSIPIKDNAIYELSDDLLKIREYEFPLQMNETTRAYFAKTGAARGDALGQAMIALAKDPADKAAEAVVNTDRAYHSLLRTTCVATRLDGGHANNALPQRAGANINCRMFPGETTEATRAALLAAIGDPKATLTVSPPKEPTAVPPPLDPKVIGPAEKLVAKYFPGVPLIPGISTGASDGIYIEQIGVPVYGVPGFWSDPDGNGVHGLNERKSERAVFVGRDFLTELVKTYAEQE